MKLAFSLERLMGFLPDDMQDWKDMRKWKIEVREAPCVENMGHGATLGQMTVTAPDVFPRDNEWRQGAVLSDDRFRVQAWLAKGFTGPVEVVLV